MTAQTDLRDAIEAALVHFPAGTVLALVVIRPGTVETIETIANVTDEQHICLLLREAGDALSASTFTLLEPSSAVEGPAA